MEVIRAVAHSAARKEWIVQVKRIGIEESEMSSELVLNIYRGVPTYLVS